MDKNRVMRFSLVERAAHWVHAASFILLIITGLVVFSPNFLFIADFLGGVQNARLVHKTAGIIFSFGTLFIFILGDRQSFIVWIKDIINFGKTDVEFLKEFPKEFFGGHPKLPEQGRFNSGEKVNSIFTLAAGALLTITGLMMWFPELAPAVLVRWAYPFHMVLAFLMVAVVIAHSYLGILHPGSKEALNGIIGGSVSREFAQAHHAKWYREVIKKEKRQ